MNDTHHPGVMNVPYRCELITVHKRTLSSVFTLNKARTQDMKRYQLLTMPIGGILLASALLMQRYLPANNLLDFLEGFLIGLSIVLNIYYVIVTSQKVRREQ